jgi:hypothetical protein
MVSRLQCKLQRDASPQDGRRRAQARLIRQEALNSVMGKAVVNSTAQAIPLRVVCPERYPHLSHEELSRYVRME